MSRDSVVDAVDVRLQSLNLEGLIRFNLAGLTPEAREEVERSRQDLIKAKVREVKKYEEIFSAFELAIEEKDDISLKTLVVMNLVFTREVNFELSVQNNSWGQEPGKYIRPSFASFFDSDLKNVDHKCAQVLYTGIQQLTRDGVQLNYMFEEAALRTLGTTSDRNNNLIVDFYRAAHAGNKDLMLDLIDKGANFNIFYESTGKTAIDEMLESKMSEDDKREVVTKFNSIYRRDPIGGAPLHGARNFESAKKLIEFGADPLATDAWGENFLHVAAHRGFLDVIQGTLSHEVIDARTAAKLLTAKDDSGSRPLDVLASKSFDEIGDKAELELIAKHIGGILRDKGLVESTDLWQDLSDAFQKFCKAVGIKTERMEVLEKIEAKESSLRLPLREGLTKSLNVLLSKSSDGLNPSLHGSDKPKSSEGRGR